MGNLPDQFQGRSGISPRQLHALRVPFGENAPLIALHGPPDGPAGGIDVQTELIAQGVRLEHEGRFRHAQSPLKRWDGLPLVGFRDEAGIRAFGEVEMASAADGTPGKILFGNPVLVEGYLWFDGHGHGLGKLDLLEIPVIDPGDGLFLLQELEGPVLAELIQAPGRFVHLADLADDRHETLAVGDLDGPGPLGDKGLQILGAHDRSGAAPAEGPGFVLDDAGAADEVLAGLSDREGMEGRILQIVPDDLQGFPGVFPPEVGGVADLDGFIVNPQVDGLPCPPLDDDRVVAGAFQFPAHVAVAQAAGPPPGPRSQGAGAHLAGPRRRRPHQGARAEDDLVGGIVGGYPGLKLVIEHLDGDAR